VDSFFTPTPIADALIAKATLKAPAVIADFAAGDGELLRVAAMRWPDARLVATDINPHSINKLRKEKNWLAYEYDFLTGHNGHRTDLPLIAKKCDLIILNPPFSCRGSKVWTTKLGDFALKTSISVAFVLRALSCLSPGGQLLAILPTGSIHSQKDRLAWKVIRCLCECDILGANDRRTFRFCSPHTVSVRLTLRLKPLPLSQSGDQKRIEVGRSKDVIVFSRGNVDMARLSKRKVQRGVSLIHTTEMNGHRVQFSRKITPAKRLRLFKGPVVLIPRVGNPRRDKIVLYTSRRKIAVSMCVLTLSCENKATAKRVYQSLISNWKAVEKQYTGTGARYLTLERLQELLIGFGFHPDLCQCLLSQTLKIQPQKNLKIPTFEYSQLVQNGTSSAGEPQARRAPA
jgi:predicted RNA methylase